MLGIISHITWLNNAFTSRHDALSTVYLPAPSNTLATGNKYMHFNAICFGFYLPWRRVVQKILIYIR